MDKSYYALGMESAERGDDSETNYKQAMKLPDDKDQLDYMLGYRDQIIHTMFDRYEVAFKKWVGKQHPAVIQTCYHDLQMFFKIKGIL